MSIKIRLLIGLVFAIISLISYYSSSSINPVTGEKQRISMSIEEETALGLHSAPRDGRTVRWFIEEPASVCVSEENRPANC